MKRDTTLKGSLLEEQALDIDELATACQVGPEWVVERVQAGLLSCSSPSGEMRFASAQLVRARRMATTERSFDANRELAALVADLIEEVEQLRRRLRR